MSKNITTYKRIYISAKGKHLSICKTFIDRLGASRYVDTLSEADLILVPVENKETPHQILDIAYGMNNEIDIKRESLQQIYNEINGIRGSNYINDIAAEEIEI